MANQVTATANLTNGSQNVIVPGVDLTGSGIIAGNGCYVVAEQARYQVAEPPTFDGTDTTIVLTCNYAGSTASGVRVVIQTAYTTLGLPRLSIVARNAGAIMAYLADRADSLLQSIISSIADLSGVTDTAAARTNLGRDNHFYNGTITPASDADVTLTAAQYKLDRLTLADGSWTAGHNIIVPDEVRRYYLDNTGGSYTATIKTSAGTGIAVLAGAAKTVVCDGTNVINPETAVLGLKQVMVDANSDGNVSRWVMSTASGGTGTENGANTWANLATFRSANATINLTRDFKLISDAAGNGSFSFTVAVRNDSTDIDDNATNISVTDITGDLISLAYDSLKLTVDADTLDTDIKLWVKKTGPYRAYTLYELGKEKTTSWSVTYNNNAAWQSATPTGAAINITSDWAGSGQLTASSVTFSNGWADYGGLYPVGLEKNADGMVNLSGMVKSGTTAGGTLILTLPATYRPAHSELFTVAKDGASNLSCNLYIDSAGQLQIHANSTGSSSWTSLAGISFRARN